MSSPPYEFPGNSDLSQVGIFNVLNQNYGPGGMVPNVNTQAQGRLNVAALQQAINAAAANSTLGGLVFIPCGTYYLSGTVSISTSGSQPLSDVGIVIAGSSEGTTLVQIDNSQLFSGNTFAVNGFLSGDGVRFQDITLEYSGTFGVAVAITDCANITCDRVSFIGCGAVSTDSKSLQCGLSDCAITYSASNSSAVMISLTGAQDYVTRCIITQTSTASSCTAILLPSVSEVYITDTSISGFAVGIWIQGGGVNPLLVHCSNVTAQSSEYAVQIQPLTGGAIIYQIFFDDCTFIPVSGSTSLHPGVYIDANGGANSDLSDIFFNNCMCYGWSGPGLQITSGQNIQIIGGRYGSCGTGLGVAGGGAAIFLTADGSNPPAANVTISGADCTPTVPGYSASPYALSLQAPVAGLAVRDCNVSGYPASTGPIYVGSSIAGSSTLDFQFTNCSGYNDQGAPLATVALATTVKFNGALYSYYGPIAFYTANAQGASITSITIYPPNKAPVTTPLLSGTFTLSPTVSAAIAYSGPVGAKPSFLVIGL